MGFSMQMFSFGTSALCASVLLGGFCHGTVVEKSHLGDSTGTKIGAAVLKTIAAEVKFELKNTVDMMRILM